MNPKNIKAAFKMRSQMKEIQKKLKQSRVTETDKSGEISVTIDGTFKIKEIKLNVNDMDQSRVKRLENNIQSTINKAIEKSQKSANSQLGSITDLLGM